MGDLANRGARAALALAILALVASCGTLPRAGPSKGQIYAGSVQRGGDAFVIEVNSRVTRATAVTASLGFPAAFSDASPIGADTIRAGDTLGLQIYENVQDGLFSGAGGAAAVNELQVDSDGFIFIPFAGRIRAAGNTPEALRRIITERLDQQTPDPQVLVRRLAGGGASVSVVGAAGGQGIYPITRPTQRLSAMIAAAGGTDIPPDIALVTVTRDGRSGTARLADLYKNATADIALRDGDTILIEQDPRTYTALGAAGAQNRVEFTTDVISAVDALAQVGGLNGDFANPTGIFVYRNEPQEIAAAVLGRDDLIGPQRLIYVIDLTKPNGLFDARDFVIRDGDTLYVTEARIVAFNRGIAALFGSLGQITRVGTEVTNIR